jgi:hypothetical protein
MDFKKFTDLRDKEQTLLLYGCVGVVVGGVTVLESISKTCLLAIAGVCPIAAARPKPIIPPPTIIMSNLSSANDEELRHLRLAWERNFLHKPAIKPELAAIFSL